MYSTSDFRNGLKVEIDGVPYVMTYFQHVKPGKGGAFVRTKLKNLMTGAVIDRTFRAGEKLEKPDIKESSRQFLYSDGEGYHFMDTGTYEQVAIPEEQVGNCKDFLTENTVVGILEHNGRIIGIDLPNFAELKVVATEPGVKGDTATGGSKPATLETGAVVSVPFFINEGDVLRIDTRTGNYVERAKSQ